MSSIPTSAYGAELQPFAGITSFMRRPVTRDLTDVDVATTGGALAVVGVPYDGGTSYRSGARFGPRKIREASLMLWGYNNPLFEFLSLLALRKVTS
jgi:arginase family enzyme